MGGVKSHIKGFVITTHSKIKGNCTERALTSKNQVILLKREPYSNLVHIRGFSYSYNVCMHEMAVGSKYHNYSVLIS